VSYGEGMSERIREGAGRVDAFIDAVGGGYVEMAIELGVHPDRIDTIANFDAVRSFGVKAEGSATASDPHTLTELVELVAGGRLDVPIAATYPLGEVREAYRQLEDGHVRGKIVLLT
jgi:NADPH:quinone reductase-like Zn-dependent oxidoreductase